MFALTAHRCLKPPRLLALLLILAVGGLTQACEDPRASAPPSPSASESSKPPFTIAEFNEWTEFRLVYGLRADAAWVTAVASDPRASAEVFDVPLLPEEAEIVGDAIASAQALVATARGYGNRYREQFGGAWIESPKVVLAFTSDLDEHRKAVNRLFGERVVIREVRFSLVELGRLAAQVGRDDEWFATMGVELVSVDVNELLNAVEVQYSAPNEAVEPQIRSRFGDTGWMELSFAGPGKWTGPVGSLELTVVDEAGRPIPVECLLTTVDPRVPSEPMPRDAPDGRCLGANLPAVEWVVEVTYDRGGITEKATERLVVPPNGSVSSTLVVGS